MEKNERITSTQKRKKEKSSQNGVQKQTTKRNFNQAKSNQNHNCKEASGNDVMMLIQRY